MTSRVPAGSKPPSPASESSSSEALRRFAAEVAEVVGADAADVSPESRLVADLDFDSLAFAELAVLMMERHGSQNFLSAVSDEVDVGALTVRSVFENYARR